MSFYNGLYAYCPLKNIHKKSQRMFISWLCLPKVKLWERTWLAALEALPKEYLGSGTAGVRRKEAGARTGVAREDKSGAQV